MGQDQDTCRVEPPASKRPPKMSRCSTIARGEIRTRGDWDETGWGIHKPCFVRVREFAGTNDRVIG